jgi:RnfABCDGE-type electron transport complex G subunit
LGGKVAKKIRDVSVLFLVGITSAFLLSFVYSQTSPLISKHREESLKKSLSEVFAEKLARFEEIKPDTLWKVFKEEKQIGIVFRYEKKGYSGLVRPIVGVDSTGKIIRVKIPKGELSETPGLGMKIAEENFLSQFQNLIADEIFLKKDKQQGKIDAVTSATISSRAATEAVREGLLKFSEFLPGYAFKEILKTYFETVEEQSPSTTLEEIEPNKLWRIADNFIYLSNIEDSSSVLKLITQIENKKIKDITIFIENVKTYEDESSKDINALKEYLERKFKGVSIQNIAKLKFESGYEKIAEKTREEIVDGYSKHIKRRER